MAGLVPAIHDFKKGGHSAALSHFSSPLVTTGLDPVVMMTNSESASDHRSIFQAARQHGLPGQARQ